MFLYCSRATSGIEWSILPLNSLCEWTLQERIHRGIQRLFNLKKRLEISYSSSMEHDFSNRLLCIKKFPTSRVTSNRKREEVILTTLKISRTRITYSHLMNLSCPVPHFARIAATKTCCSVLEFSLTVPHFMFPLPCLKSWKQLGHEFSCSSIHTNHILLGLHLTHLSPFHLLLYWHVFLSILHFTYVYLI